MNVASLELCKELYEMSGWEDTFMMVNAHSGRVRVKESPYYGGEVPAYDLGYLLRKLPLNIPDPVDSTEVLALGLGTHHRDARKWCISYVNLYDRDEYYDSIELSPEDAAAKLAIQLFEEGILK